MAFTHLHVHTGYSILDGSAKIGELVARAKELGMDSLAITDHGAMYGVIEFYQACQKEGIHPVIGCEVYVAPGSRLEHEPGASEDRYYHLVLLAEDNIGYHNLIKIVSRGFIDGYYYKPRVDMEVLQKYHEGVIALSACLAGEVARNLERDNYKGACDAAKKYEECFGQGNFFLELQDHGYDMQKKVNAGILRMSEELGIPMVATNDSHYIYPEDAEAHDILLCIQTGKKLSDEDRMRYEGGQFYLKSEEEMRELFPYAPEALDNTHRIAERCQVTIEFGKTRLPHFEVPEGYDSWTYLNHLCEEGFRRCYPDDDGTAARQLQYELKVIQQMGYVDYFLIVWDYVNFARSHGIMVGPGRGSAAGSIVSYCLNITQLDPLKYQLVFERFLNPERVSMPDIDVDFADERRGEVLDYVTRKYGSDHVVQIVTFGNLRARQVVRDVGRVMDLPYSLCDKVSKAIPREPKITLDEAVERSSDLREMIAADPQVARMVEMAKRLEGLPRNISTHAAGVVIGPAAMDEFVPLSRSSEGQLTTQFNMTEIEQLGLLKMDFLGLRTLTVIQETCRMIHEQGRHLDITRIAMDDRKVYDQIASGHTEGIFQLESSGMQSFMRELRPGSLEDLMAGISLYRPGPMDFIPQYVRGKNNPKSVTYMCPQLEPILKTTYGCMVYQEQVMQIVRDLGGYTLGRSDLVRRAMSKKKHDVMQRERQNFVYGNEEEGVPGCVARGIDAGTANQIFDAMMDFASYAFNKAHGASYAVVTYQTAYLRTYYPAEFMAALMNSFIDNTEKVSGYIKVCRDIGIGIQPPDVNRSEWRFTVSDHDILFGLTAVRGLGRNIAEMITQERETNGPYRDLRDFIERTTGARSEGRDLNKRTVESFIKAGALDCLPGNRRQKMMIYAELMDSVQRDKKGTYSGQLSLFDLMGEADRARAEIRMPEVDEFPKSDLLAFEKEVLGVYISGHPLDDDRKLWERQITARAEDFRIDPETGRAGLREGSIATVGGILVSKSVKTTKNNQTMAFLTIEDLTGTLEIIVFPRDYERSRAELEPDRRLLLRGRVSIGSEDEQGKLVCERVIGFDEIPKEIWVQFADREEYERRSLELDEVRAGRAVTVFLARERQIRRIPGLTGREGQEELIRALVSAFGDGNVRGVEKKLEDVWKMR